MKKIALAFLAITALLHISASNKKKGKALEAKMVYEIVYEELPEMLQAYESMLPKQVTTYIKGNLMRIEQSTMGATSVNVFDLKKNTGFMLLDQFGDRVAYTMDAKDLKKNNNDDPKNNLEYKYLTETKELAGYTCKKVEITNSTLNFQDYAWVTEEIEGVTKQYPGLKGYPLEYSVHAQEDMVMVMKIKTFEKMKLSKSYFEIPKGYTKKSYAELEKQIPKQ